MKSLFGFCLLILLSIAALGQTLGTVSGRVVILAGGKSGVSTSRVTLTSLTQSDLVYTAVADAGGNFVIRDVQPGEYRLTASGGILGIAGLRADQKIRVTSGENPPLEIAVDNSDLTISESVTVSVSSSQPIEQVSKTVDLITSQEMRDRADFTLVDTVRIIPGFRVQQFGGFGRTASIKTRGLRNQDTAVLIDGIRFRDPGSITGDASPFLSDITLTSVSRIEVLRGSGSSLYGTNAIGGTLDFQTPVAEDGFHGQVSTAAGGLGMGRFRGNVSYGDASVPFVISGALSRTAVTKGIDGDDNADNTNFQSRIDFNPDRTTLSARFFVSQAKVRLNSSPDTLGELPPATTIIDAVEGVNFIADVDDPDSIQRSRFFTGQFVVNHLVHQNFVIGGYYQGLTSGRRNDDGLLGVGFQSEFTSIFEGAIHTGNVHVKWIPTQSSVLTAGYEVELESFRNASLTPGGEDDFTTHAGQHSHTLYAHYAAGFLDDRLQLAGGVRAQWFSLDQPIFSQPDSPYSEFTLEDPPAAYIFDGSAAYLVRSTGTKFRVHAGNGYRLPSLYERFGTSFFFGTLFPQGNPELEPERSLGIDAGVDQFWLNNRFKASATWFYTRIEDEITYLPTDDFGAPAYYNFDRHYSRGAEFSFDARPTRSTDIFVSYTFTNSDIRNFRRPDFIQAVARPDRTSFGIPAHQFTFVVTQRFKRFWISADALATSSYLAPIFSSSNFNQYTYRFEGNRRVDLTAGYTFPLGDDRLILRLFGTVENLFDNDYFENGFRTVPRNGRVGLSFGF